MTCQQRITRRLLEFVLLAGMMLVTAPLHAADPGRAVGDRAPHFAVASSHDTLFDYDRDIYGRHHLLLTFFPAAFTPV